MNCGLHFPIARLSLVCMGGLRSLELWYLDIFDIVNSLFTHCWTPIFLTCLTSDPCALVATLQPRRKGVLARDFGPMARLLCAPSAPLSPPCLLLSLYSLLRTNDTIPFEWERKKKTFGLRYRIISVSVSISNLDDAAMHIFIILRRESARDSIFFESFHDAHQSA